MSGFLGLPPVPACGVQSIWAFRNHARAKAGHFWLETHGTRKPYTCRESAIVTEHDTWKRGYAKSKGPEVRDPPDLEQGIQVTQSDTKERGHDGSKLVKLFSHQRQRPQATRH